MSVTLTRFGTLVITRSSMLLPQVGFFIESCQEVVVKDFNKGWFVNTRCAVNGVPEDVWQISHPKLPYCRTGHKLHAENYRIHPSNLRLQSGWPIAKTE